MWRREKHSFCRVVCRHLISHIGQLRTNMRLGDCAELFAYCNQDMIDAKVKLLLQMSLILIWGKLYSIWNLRAVKG
jgi:3-deoxy-D-arabino-heptulosonate 7-phosphate (DAHP) synthase class II